MLGHDIAAALPDLQAHAESLLVDTFTVYKPNGTTTDPDDFEVPAFASQGSTKGKVQGPSSQATDTATQTATVGGVERPVVAGGLHIPVSAPNPAAGPEGVGWEYVCTAVGAMSDTSLVGRRWRVVNAPAKTYATARRLDVVEVPL